MNTALLRGAVDAGDVPGVVAAVTTRDATIYEAAYGVRVLGQAPSMSMDTVMWIASMTKPVVGAAAMQLVEQGKIGLDDPAARIIPELGEFKVLEGWEFEPGGGGLYSTASDYLRFMRMILDGGRGNGNQVLRPETVELMSRNATGALRVAMLPTQNPVLSRDAEFFAGTPKTWGLSFMINEETAPTGRSAGSLAWAGLANTYFWIDPTRGIGGLIMMQILPFVDAKALALFYAYEKRVYESPA